MATRTAIIDIGSNSARLVIFERSSRYGFHIICEQKSKVRIGEGAYLQGGELQSAGIQRAYKALASFVETISKYRVQKTIAIATSALRDAPNALEFIEWIRKHLGLNIKIIDGDKEAYYGGLAASNLLAFDEGITIDIGGGSSDMTLVRGGKIIETYSLDIGTVRIKELFFDTNKSLDGAKKYIDKELARLPASFVCRLAIGIGGTARTLGKSVMKRNGYVFDKLHAFGYTFANEEEYFDSIVHAQPQTLESLSIQSDRHDTIREGTLIFMQILQKIGAEEILTSGVGVREGVFLADMLRNSGQKFPKGINTSIVSIRDRFVTITKGRSFMKHRIKVLGRVLPLFTREFGFDVEKYRFVMESALQLSNIGNRLTIYRANQHAFYIAMQELNYGFTHSQMATIALLLRTGKSSLIKKSLYSEYKSLLPPRGDLKVLSFIHSLVVALHENSKEANVKFKFKNKTLIISADKPLHHAKEALMKLEKPYDFEIFVDESTVIPKYHF